MVMWKMEIGKYNLKKAKIDTLPKDERLFFIQILNFLNDLNSFQKLLFLSTHYKDSDCGVQKEGQNVMSQSLFLNLVGVIIEGWNLIDKATKKESLKAYIPLKEKYLKNFEKHFGKNGGFREIRNRFINHYDSQSIEEYYKNSDISDFNLYFSDNFGFNFSTIHHLIFTSIFHDLGFNPEKKGLQACFDEVYKLILKSAKSLQTFIVEYFVIVLNTHFNEDLENIVHMELENLPEIDDVNVPFLFI